jgi:hypothetical protein
MSDGRETPDNGGPDQGPPGSAMPSIDTETSKKLPSAIPKTAFDDGALKVMEDEFQVSIFFINRSLCFVFCLFRLYSMNLLVVIEV